jgi:hypothetical protein
VRAARRRLVDAAADPALRSAAAWLLRHEPTRENARDLAEAWETAAEQVRPVAAESLEVLLAYRFESATAAKAWFDANSQGSFVGWVTDLSRAKDSPDWPLYARMVQEAKANLERSTAPKDLRRYLSPAETPWPEVRRIAARRAAKIEAPGDEWLAVLTPAFEMEQDRETLLALLEVARRVRPSAPAAGHDLARAVLRQLNDCCAEPELAVRLLAVLGIVGDSKAVSQAYEVLERMSHVEIQETWIQIAAAVGGNELALMRFHGARAGLADETAVRLRAKALEAMALGAARSPPENGARAARYLRAVLRSGLAPDADGDAPRERAPAARLAAVRGLEGFPGEATVARLSEIAAARDDATLALAAVRVLGRLSPKQDEAVAALLEVAADGAPVDLRVEALRSLGKAAPDLGATMRATATPAVRELLASTSSPYGVRRAALDAAASFADGEAVSAGFALAASLAATAEGPPREVLDSLDRLVQTVAQTDGAHDAAITQGLAVLADAKALDAAIELANLAADAGTGRFALQAARADLYWRRAQVEGRPVEARVDDLLAAQRILRSVVREDSPPEDRRGEAWKRALSTYDGVVQALLAAPTPLEPAALKACWIEGIRVAVLRGDEPAARRAREWLASVSALDLAAAERALVDALGEKLDAILHPAPPR